MPDDITLEFNTKISSHNNIKNILPIILKISLPASSIIAAFLFWNYLLIIGRPELFIQSLSSISGIISFLFIFTTMAFLGVIIITIPSAFLIYASYEINKFSVEAGLSLPKAIWWLCLGVFLTPILMTKVGVWSIIIGPLIGVGLNLLSLYKKKQFFYGGNISRRKRQEKLKIISIY